jgi:hypothetical protein
MDGETQDSLLYGDQISQEKSSISQDSIKKSTSIYDSKAYYCYKSNANILDYDNPIKHTDYCTCEQKETCQKDHSWESSK